MGEKLEIVSKAYLSEQAEKLYYTALIGYIWYEAPEDEKNFTTLLEMINASEARKDNEDFQNPVDLILPFRDVINEYYAKDISKKIKSTFKAKGESGKHVASSPPYSYLKDSEDKNKWVIDEVAAPIVRRIFRMTLGGYGPYQIAQKLSDEHIPIPAYHQAQLGVGLWQSREIKYPYK